MPVADVPPFHSLGGILAGNQRLVPNGGCCPAVTGRLHAADRAVNDWERRVFRVAFLLFRFGKRIFMRRAVVVENTMLCVMTCVGGKEGSTPGVACEHAQGLQHGGLS